MPSPISPALQIPLSDAQRGACEITPFPPLADIHAAMEAPKVEDRVAYVVGREVAHNATLGVCNVRGAALIKAIDDGNAALRKLAGR